MFRDAPVHLAVALDGVGWHPAAWRQPGARPGDVLTAAYWADLVLEAERGLLDFVTIEDGFAPPSVTVRTAPGSTPSCWPRVSRRSPAGSAWSRR